MAKEKINALMLDDEQPHSVPENWQWVKMGEITQIIGGGTPSSGKEGYYKDGTIPWISPADLSGFQDIYISHGSKYITELGLQNSSARLMPKDTVCLSTRAPIGYVAIAQNALATNQGFKSFLPAACYMPHYLYWYLKGNKHMLNSMASGTTFLELSGSKAANIKFPLPPIPEQQRIVDRIESLFAKLDEAKEKAQAVVDGFEDRKAAILHKAFTGELTAEWRKKTKVERNSWQHVSVKEICHDVKVGIVIKPSRYYTDKLNGTPAFRSANVREFHIDDFDWVYLNAEGMDENKRSIVHVGDVLIVRSGNPGTACVVEERYDGYNAIDVLIAVPDETKVTAEYLCAFTNSPLGRKLVAENKRGMALTHFNVSGYSALTLELPSISEQKEIVSIMHEMLEHVGKAKDAAEQVISQIDTMKKAILARAFRGELGTNDPSEPPADLGV